MRLLWAVLLCALPSAVVGVTAGTARADDDRDDLLVNLDDARWKPLPGRDVVKAGPPDWCAGADTSEFVHDASRTLVEVDRFVDGGNNYSEKGLRAISRGACRHPSDEPLQRAVARYRQRYINLVGTSEAEDRAAQKVRASKQYEQLQSAWCDARTPDEEASLEERSLFEALSAGTGCAYKGHGGPPLSVYADDMNKELGWWVDQRAEVGSEIVRAVYVSRCLRILENDADWPNPDSSRVMGAYATCGPDARRLSKERLEKELADARFNDFARINAREVFGQAKAVADMLRAAYEKKAQKDAAYKKLLFDAPEKGWTDWEKAYAANKEAFEAARAYEKKYYGPSKKALSGCGQALRANFNAYIKSKKPSSPDEARAAALDPIGYVLLESLALCDGVEGRLQTSFTLNNLLFGEGNEPPPFRRGPRVASYQAAVAALSDILADRERFPMQEFFLPLEAPENRVMEGTTSYYTNKIAFAEDPRGTIGSIKAVGGKVNVGWKPVTTMILNRVCKPNRRILMINAGGHVVYDSDCSLGTPPKIPVTTKEKALDVPALLGGALKVGQTATFSVNVRDEPGTLRDGVPKEVWEGGRLVIWYGVTL